MVFNLHVHSVYIDNCPTFTYSFILKSLEAIYSSRTSWSKTSHTNRSPIFCMQLRRGKGISQLQSIGFRPWDSEEPCTLDMMAMHGKSIMRTHIPFLQYQQGIHSNSGWLGPQRQSWPVFHYMSFFPFHSDLLLHLCCKPERQTRPFLLKLPLVWCSTSTMLLSSQRGRAT